MCILGTLSECQMVWIQIRTNILSSPSHDHPQGRSTFERLFSKFTFEWSYDWANFYNTNERIRLSDFFHRYSSTPSSVNRIKYYYFPAVIFQSNISQFLKPFPFSIHKQSCKSWCRNFQVGFSLNRLKFIKELKYSMYLWIKKACSNVLWNLLRVRLNICIQSSPKSIHSNI